MVDLRVDLHPEPVAELRRMADEYFPLVPYYNLRPSDPNMPRVPVLSVIHDTLDADRLAFALDRRWGIAARAGLHCAPWAHRTVGTLDTGALRLGIGYGNTDADIDAALAALGTLAREGA